MVFDGLKCTSVIIAAAYLMFFLRANVAVNVKIGIVDDETYKVCYSLLNQNFTNANVTIVKFEYGFLLDASTYDQDVDNFASNNFSAVIYHYSYQLMFLSNASRIPYYVILNQTPMELLSTAFVVDSKTFDVALAFHQFTLEIARINRVVIICDVHMLYMREIVMKLFEGNKTMYLITLQSGFENNKLRLDLLKIPTDSSTVNTIFLFLPSQSFLNRTTDVLDQGLFSGHMNLRQIWFLGTLSVPNHVLLRYSKTMTFIVTLRMESGKLLAPKLLREAICKDAVNHYINSVQNVTNATDAMSLLHETVYIGEGAAMNYTLGGNYNSMEKFIYVSTFSKQPNSVFSIGTWIGNGVSSTAKLSTAWIKEEVNSAIRVAVFNQYPWFFRTNSGEASGFAKDLFDLLKGDNGIEWVAVPDNSTYGSFNASNGTWDGIMGILSRGEADVSGVPLLKSYIKMSYVEFSSLVLEDGVDFLVRQEAFDIDWLKLLSPFSLLVWLATAALFVLLCLFLIIINAASPNMILDKFANRGLNDNWRSATIGDICFAVFSTMIISPHDFYPRMCSYRVYNSFMTFGALIFTASYAAGIVAKLASESFNHEHRFNSFLEVYEARSQISWIFETDLDFARIFKRMNGSTFVSHAARNWPSEMFTNSIMDAENRLLANPDLVFIGRYSWIQYLGKKNCHFDFSSSSRPRNELRSYLAFNKNFRNKLLISNKIDQLRQYQKIKNLWDKWITFTPCKNQNHWIANVKDISSLFILLAGGIVLGCIFGICECCVRAIGMWRFRRKLPKFFFGNVYDATVLKTETSGAWVSVKGRTNEEYFVRNSHLDPGPIKVSKPEELNLRPQSKLKVRYLGKNPKKKTRRLVRVIADEV